VQKRCFALSVRFVLSFFFLFILAGAAALWLLGSTLTAVEPHPVALPADLAARAQPLSLPAGPGQTVAASFLPGGGKGALLLLIDLPGQGASTSSAVTFGLREAEGVRSALDYLRRQAPGQRIGVIGVSLGAASLVLCRDCPRVDAAVLESMYPSIEEAVQDRLRIRLGALGAPLARLLLWQLPLRLDIQPSQLRPIARIGELRVPLLIAAGSEDRHTLLPETERIYAAAGAPKSLWVVQGAAHQDLHAFAPAEYERRIGAFLACHVSMEEEGAEVAGR